MPEVSIIIPTYNRLDRLRQVIAALECQQYPTQAYEVLVISDGSTDGTHTYLERLQTSLQLRWIAQKNGGPAAARNNGIRQAQGEFILFIDDDVVPEPQLIAEHMQSHRTAEREVVVLGPMLSPEGFEMAPWVCWEQAMLVKQYKGMQNGEWEPTARQFYTGNASLRRQHVLDVGGFDEHFRRAEDVELAYRLADRGIGFIFNPMAVGMHYAERSFGSWLEIPYAYGRNDVIFGRDRQQEWILNVARYEFYQRNILIQQLAHVCIGRPRLSKVATLGLKRIASAGAHVRSTKITQLAYSALFSLRYYQGFCDELGNSRFFHAPQSLPQHVESL